MPKIGDFPDASANMSGSDIVTGLQNAGNVNFSKAQLIGGNPVLQSTAPTPPSIQLARGAFITFIAGDMWITTNAFYDGTHWQRVDTGVTSFALNFQTYNNIPGESATTGVLFWRAVSGSNPIGAFSTFGGWELMFGETEFRDWVCGGFGLEVDGNGTTPFGRFINLSAGNVSPKRRGVLTNLFAGGSGVDDITQPSWFAGPKDDGFVVERAPAAGTTTASLVTLLAVDPSGNLSPTLASAANDSAAASAGVPVGGLYQNAGAVRVRLT